MRNTTLILGTVASLTFATLTPALAARVRTPSLDPVYGIYDNTTTHGSSYQRVYGASYQVAPERAQPTRHHHGGYYHHG